MARAMIALARQIGVDLVGPDGLLTGLTKQVLELALEEKLTDPARARPPRARTSATGRGPRR
ncbi:MAG: hypothetical protein BGO37_12700 [Cellulomonas sp. 73-92]|nr:MAG: hypothetical protein BGO37_12700 [Cellulomonas sp. 73-92]